MSKGFIIVLVVAVAGLIGIFIATTDFDQQQTAVDNPHEITEEDHTLGPSDAPITLVEYGDFQCPHCAQAHPVVKNILDEHEGDVQFVYRHYHVTQPNLTTLNASRTAVAAKRQDQFWEMHDLLFERQDEWGQDPDASQMFRDYAEELSLDMDQFEQDFEEAQSRVERDVSIAQQLSVASTPTFYLNGELVEDSFRELPKRVESELETRETADEDNESSDQ